MTISEQKNTFLFYFLFHQIPTFALPASAAESPCHGGGGGPAGENTFMKETFEYPFSELVVWAVLTKRKDMSRLMWQHGEQVGENRSRCYFWQQFSAPFCL